MILLPYPTLPVGNMAPSIPRLVVRYESEPDDFTLASQSTALTSSGHLGVETISSGSDSALKAIDSASILTPSFLKEKLITLHGAGLVAGISIDPDPNDQDVLESYACSQDREGFAGAISRMPWEYQPSDVIARTIDLALSLDLPRQAAEAARAGLARFPDDLRFRQASRVLELPVVRSIPSQHAGGLSASQVWLRDHAAPYRGQWVVVREGHLLGVAPDLGSLRTLIERENDPATTIITRVW